LGGAGGDVKLLGPHTKETCTRRERKRHKGESPASKMEKQKGGKKKHMSKERSKDGGSTYWELKRNGNHKFKGDQGGGVGKSTEVVELPQTPYKGKEKTQGFCGEGTRGHGTKATRGVG